MKFLKGWLILIRAASYIKSQTESFLRIWSFLIRLIFFWTIGRLTSFFYNVCNRYHTRRKLSIFRDRKLTHVEAHFRWRQFSPLHLSFLFFSFLLFPSFSIPLSRWFICFLFDCDVRSDSRSGMELFSVWEMFLMRGTVLSPMKEVTKCRIEQRD